MSHESKQIPTHQETATVTRSANLVVTIFTEMLLSESVPHMAATGPVSAALQAWRERQKAEIAQVLRNSVVCLPFGQRIRNLRSVLGWSQRQAAVHFGVSVRTVIRHERGESCWLRLPVLLELRALEAANAEELVAYLVHLERDHLAGATIHGQAAEFFRGVGADRHGKAGAGGRAGAQLHNF